MRERRHAQRIPVPEQVSLPCASYTDAFAIEPTAQQRPALDWMRGVFEHAPAWVRWLLRPGWRLVLGFRPGPSGSPEHVLGWPVGESSPGRVVLMHSSSLLTAHLALEVEGPRLIWVTAVRYHRRPARLIWPPLALIHRRMVPWLLERVAS